MSKVTGSTGVKQKDFPLGTMELLFSPSGLTKLPYLTGRPGLGAAVSQALSCHFLQDQPFVPTATTLALWHINRSLRPVLPGHPGFSRGMESGSRGARAESAGEAGDCSPAGVERRRGLEVRHTVLRHRVMANQCTTSLPISKILLATIQMSIYI